jgi:hypothetical protein
MASGVVVLVGCGQISPAQAEHLTSVNIRRPQNYYLKPLDVTVTNVNTVTTLYRDIRALKPFPSEAMHCPAYLGINYRIQFKRDGHVVLTAHADPTGCTEVGLSTGKNRWGVGTTGQALWRELAKALGMPRVSDLWSPSHASG